MVSPVAQCSLSLVLWLLLCRWSLPEQYGTRALAALLLLQLHDIGSYVAGDCVGLIMRLISSNWFWRRWICISMP